ncbi:AT-rich interactive domain-containing protein 4-like [Cucurbita maxima]|uniref:AT-rich interactive domain-containing protein 4-like n=1 Tax=Cucurbita maxima TaxID=3661 RepID=A0A6J1IWJ8_CUCMA|nr:AT-rich interactive domain-containing protein 4-like [Cucurbita maxima]XP_022980514.1 AT-rich interactive domain-containing protein 4-like [Cucurbita maxima]XP_022980515.1 AT-rich interactive domain-containing protein 4-like [Cucurbita maxima]XP_022980516.1 AT-rich interactive domain-containing protein 4-like [Cucurbita maxima]XP_022980517.1 AT-rich interactive domain-containing protein 4-like [Cucurbita maxima]XP_022980518.1 AT-rich interactive domain-containing protein 4-like [Cucurbita m
MLHSVIAARQTCSLLAVTCGSVVKAKCEEDVDEDKLKYPFPGLVSSGRLEVRALTNPSTDEFSRIVESCLPSFVYLQGEQLGNDEIGSLVWNGVDLFLEDLCGLFNTALPTVVYLEIPNGGRIAEALHSKGIPYVMYWNSTFSCYAAAHFRNALFSVLQSSSTHTWDAFQLARAAFRLHCMGSNHALPGIVDSITSDLEPQVIGEPLKINVEPPKVVVGEGEDEDGSLETLTAISIHDNNVTVRFLICGVACTPDACLLRSLEDGLNALLNIEIRGCKLQGKFSAPPPPLQAGSFARGVVTMRCDMVTCSSAHISILVSGSPHTCFDDQLLEKHIKHEIIENSQLVHAMYDCEDNKHHMHEPRKSASVACGATVFEVSMKVPAWASQVLRQLAPDMSYRSLVALGIGGVQGLPVASFEKEDAERLLFFCSKDVNDKLSDQLLVSVLPSWFKPPPPSRKRVEPSQGIRSTLLSHDRLAYANIPSIRRVGREEPASMNGFKSPLLSTRKRLKVASMRPIPRVHRNKMMPFSGLTEADGNNGGQPKACFPVVTPSKHVTVGSTSATQRKSFSSSSQSKQIISLNPLPLKKHGCGRNPIQDCSEEEFLKDVMEFLLLRGHSRLIPQGGLEEFPDAILNGKRLDLFNLYKEVVTRGGFHVGNGINWKGQIFSKMHNYTMSNRMTGVGNTLKRHYETYLLEYELAHDDVDGECCLLCHSSAAGDWVNCGICGEWAHFGCDRRQGLGAFKDYAKTDGLEYVCPHCSITTYNKKKPHRVANGSPQGLTNPPRIP